MVVIVCCGLSTSWFVLAVTKTMQRPNVLVDWLIKYYRRLTQTIWICKCKIASETVVYHDWTKNIIQCWRKHEPVENCIDFITFWVVRLKQPLQNELQTSSHHARTHILYVCFKLCYFHNISMLLSQHRSCSNRHVAYIWSWFITSKTFLIVKI